MRSTYTTPFFTTTGSKTAGAGCVMVILLFTLALTMQIISFAIPHKAGEWWMWTIALAGMVAWGIYQNKKDKVSIELHKLSSGQLLVKLKGPTTDIEIPVRPEQISYWYTHHHMRAKHGGGILVIYFCAIPKPDGSAIYFKQMLGSPGTEPHDWRFVNEEISEGEGVFHCHQMVEFIRATQRP